MRCTCLLRTARENHSDVLNMLAVYGAICFAFCGLDSHGRCERCRCNKMTCTKCGAFFCWLCDTVIHGYDHFQRGKCAGQLFPREEWAQQDGDNFLLVADGDEEGAWEEEHGGVVDQMWRWQRGL